MYGIATICLPLLALWGTVLGLHAARRHTTGQAVFDGGILLAGAIAGAAALPILSDLSGIDLIDELSEQAIAAIQLLKAAYIILTL